MDSKDINKRGVSQYLGSRKERYDLVIDVPAYSTSNRNMNKSRKFHKENARAEMY